MGRTNFFVYDGHARVLDCPVQDYVFTNMDAGQPDKVFAGINSDFSEVWWLYPSADGDGECDSYVVYDYQEQTWTVGTLDRTVWADAGILVLPLAVSSDGYIYTHESGTDDGSTSPATAIQAYIQSSQLEMDPGGNSFIFANRVVPDVTFRGSTGSPSVDFIFYPQDYPGAPLKDGSTSPVARSTTTTIQEFTEQAWVRLRGRAMVFRVESNDLGVAFRLGMPRLDMRPDGKR